MQDVRVYETPEFVTKPQTLLVNEGDTIRLPCFVNRLEVELLLELSAKLREHILRRRNLLLKAPSISNTDLCMCRGLLCCGSVGVTSSLWATRSWTRR